MPITQLEIVDKSSPIPSSFVLVETLSKCVLRNWPPSCSVPPQEQANGAQPDCHYRYDAALAALEFMEEDIISSLRKVGRAILAARNNASLIFQLPTEVFRRVFAFLGGDIRDKLSVSQTCSLWRTIITEDPFVWTNIDLDTIQTPEIASKVFRNAKNYPLQLRCKQWSDLRLHCVTLEMDRIEELETVFTVPTFRRLCRTPAPILKGFSIAVPEHSAIFTYLPYLFANTHPELSELTMVDCRLVLTTANYRGLTKLNIRFTGPTMSLRQDEDFFCILRGSPDLEEIRFENMNLCRDSQEPLEVVHLPRLRIMHLRLTVYDLKCILSAISAPPSLRLSVAPISRHGDRNYSSILSRIASPGQPSLVLLTESVFLDADPTKHGIFTYRDTLALLPALSYRAVSPMAPAPAEPNRTSADLSALVDIHTMSTLERVRLRDINPAPIAKLLAKSPAITDIELLYSQQGIGNTEVIATIMHEFRRHTPADPFLPALRTLRLQEVYISVETLFDLIELRRACPEFKNIYLHACRGDLTTDELVEILKAEFGQAEWTEGPHLGDRSCRQPPSQIISGAASGQ